MFPVALNEDLIAVLFWIRAQRRSPKEKTHLFACLISVLFWERQNIDLYIQVYLRCVILCMLPYARECCVLFQVVVEISASFEGGVT